MHNSARKNPQEVLWRTALDLNLVSAYENQMKTTTLLCWCSFILLFLLLIPPFFTFVHGSSNERRISIACDAIISWKVDVIILALF